jgi:IS30 family transposase
MSINNQSQLDKMAKKLNIRPRKTLGFIIPGEVFEEALN